MQFALNNMRNFFTPVLVLIAVLQCSSGRSATVTSPADSGLGSLREAIANAVSGETIQFSTGDTITLTSGELEIDKDLIISGPGASNLLIQRSTAADTPDFAIFRITTAKVIISGLTVSNGRDDVGGGIYAKGNLTLNDCVISGNVATESGGGIVNLSSMSISNCVIRGNSAAGQTSDGFGGGIYNAGTLIAINNTISDNSVVSGTGGAFGGGVCNDGTLTLTRTVVHDNSATGVDKPDTLEKEGGLGGGIYVGFGTAYVVESTVRGNVARGGAGSESEVGIGGGVANGLGTTELNRSTVSANLAVGGERGGAGAGGGIANDAGTVYLESSTVSGNVSSGGAGTVGGGIFNDLGTVELTFSTIAANVVPGGFAEDGGGIFNSWGSVELK